MTKIPRTSQLNYFTEQLKSNPESMIFPPALPPPKSWKSEQYNTLWGRKKPFPLWNVIGIETGALIQPAGRQNQILFQTRGEKGRGREVWNQEKWFHLLQKIKAHCTMRARIPGSQHMRQPKSLRCFLHHPQYTDPAAKSLTLQESGEM